jgi:lipid-binding SYLF domain-containing protein
MLNSLKNYALALLATLLIATASPLALADKAAEIDRDVDSALQKLYREAPAAAELAKTAKGVLVFPNVIKAGLLVGGQYGEGALRMGGSTVGYFNIAAASYGLQAGAQSFGYAMFFMTDSALEHVKRSDGWEVGAGPSFVVVDEGLARSLTTTSAREDVYVFIFGQRGLMGGIGVQGSKISPITP